MSVQRQRPSRKDVADAASVSVSTVSVVLNGQGDQHGVAKITQQRVREAAERLRYIPHSAGRAIAARRFRTFGIVARRPFTTLHLPVFQDLIVAAIGHAARHDYSVKILPPAAEADSYDIPATLRDAHVDGLIVNGLLPLAEQLADWSVPLVYIGLGGPDLEPHLVGRVGAVTADGYYAPQMAARHFLARGHTHIALIAGPAQAPSLRAGVPTMRNRLTAFTDELRSASRGVVLHEVTTRDWSGAEGFLAMRALLADQPEVTAVHAGSDWMASGVLRAAHQAGRRVPDDLEVIGFGDFQMSEFTEPPLTTIRWPLDDVAKNAVELLMAQLAGHDSGYRNMRFTADLIIRESSPGPPECGTPSKG